MYRTSLLAFLFFLIRLFLVIISLQRKNILGTQLRVEDKWMAFFELQTITVAFLQVRRTPLDRHYVLERCPSSKESA